MLLLVLYRYVSRNRVLFFAYALIVLFMHFIIHNVFMNAKYKYVFTVVVFQSMGTAI